MPWRGHFSFFFFFFFFFSTKNVQKREQWALQALTHSASNGSLSATTNGAAMNAQRHFGDRRRRRVAKWLSFITIETAQEKKIVSILLLQFIRFRVVQNLCSSKQLEITIVLEFYKLCLHVSHSKMNKKLIVFLVNYPKHI